MSSSDRSPDLSRVINELSRQVANLASSLDGGHSRPGSGGGGRAKPSEGGLDITAKTIKELNAGLKHVDKTLDKLNRGANDVAESTKDLYNAQSILIKGIVNGGKKSEAQQQKLIEKVDNVIKAHSILGVSLSNTAKSAEHLNRITEQTGEFLHTYTELLKKANAQSLEGITNADDLQDALLRMQREMDLGSEVNELIRKKDFAAAAKKIDDDAKNAVLVRNQIKKTANSFNTLTNVTTGLKNGLSKATDVIGAGFIKEAMTWGGAMGLIVSGAKDAYVQFKNTASSGFGGQFINLSKTAIGLGISLEALTKITKDNMNLVGKMGLTGFNNSLKESQIALMKLGLTTEEAAKTRALMNENAMLTGVDISNKKELNHSVSQQIASYESLRATTGESIEVLAQQSKAILNSNDSMKIMSAMTRQQRVQMLQSINLERARLTALGLSNEAAMDVVKTVQSMKNEKTVTRLDQANNLQAGGAAIGMDGAWTSKIAAIMTKSKGSRTAEDDAAIADYAREANKKAAAMQSTTDLGRNIQGDQAEEWLGPLRDIGEKMAGSNMDRGLTKEQIDANKANGRMPQVVAEGVAKIESGLQWLQSPLVKIAAGVAGIALLLMMRKRTEDGSGLGTRIMSGFKKATGIGKNTTTADAGCGHPCCPGDSVGGPNKINPRTGFMGMSEFATERSAAKKYAAEQATSNGRSKANSASIGSQTLQERLAANKKVVEGRATGPNIGNELPGNRVPGVGLGSKLMSGASKLGAKAIPYIGWAIAGFEAIAGAFDGVAKAGEIFGVDTKKEALTTAQKVSAGMAGALSTITLGLIPTDSTARLFNDIATDGVSVLTDYWEEGMEFMYNKAVPALWDGFKSVLGFLSTAIVDLLNPMTWINVFTGGGDGGMVSAILSSVWKGMEFMVVALAKGAVKIGTDAVNKLFSFLPKWMQPNLGGPDSWASSDTHISDFDTKKEAEARQVRKEHKNKRDNPYGPSSDPDKVQGTPINPSDTGMLGMATEFNSKLTAEQLAVQGIQASPSSVNSPGAEGNRTSVASPNGNTTVNNTTNNSTTAPKSESENLLSGILEKMTKLVELTDKNLEISKDSSKTGTLGLLAGNKNNTGYAPSMQSFINNMMS